MRTLERRIAGICRAVAVKVLENPTQDLDLGKKEQTSQGKDESQKESASAFIHPPDMPIIIDEAALEDILGVNIYFYIL